MLHITIPAVEGWDEQKEEFVILEKEQNLQLEHSLVSLSKWESKWCKSYLATREKTYEEVLDYIKCMTITQNVKPDVYLRLTQDNIDDIITYINAPMTATNFSAERNSGTGREVITAELIYYWMIALSIPPQYEKWHLNRLMTLIKVCNIKNQSPKKMSRGEIMRRNRSLNEARKQRLNTKG